jgi:hypothetical protein
MVPSQFAEAIDIAQQSLRECTLRH